MCMYIDPTRVHMCVCGVCMSAYVMCACMCMRVCACGVCVYVYVCMCTELEIGI